jgi:molybdopterin converting factor small subunit
VTVEAVNVRDALRKLVAAYPGLDGRVLADNELPLFLNVFLDGEDVRLRQGLDTPIEPQSTLLLLPAVAGGQV